MGLGGGEGGLVGWVVEGVGGGGVCKEAGVVWAQMGVEEVVISGGGCAGGEADRVGSVRVCMGVGRRWCQGQSHGWRWWIGGGVGGHGL